MYTKKAYGKVYGMGMSSNEKKAMDMEIKRQLSEYDRKHALELDAIVLWIFHEECKYGKNRLKRVYNRFEDYLDDLVKRYELEDRDKIWLATYELFKYGIDLEEWQAEREEKKRVNDNPKKNMEGYSDPTAYAAIKNMEMEEERFNKLLHTIFHICELAGFHLEGRITLVDNKTGRVWK